LEDEVLRFRPADLAEVFERAAKAGEAGDPDAAFEAALAFWNPEGNTTQDQNRARRLFEIAAEDGLPGAKRRLQELPR
jgi:TPR repeat protein